MTVTGVMGGCIKEHMTHISSLFLDTQIKIAQVAEETKGQLGDFHEIYVHANEMKMAPILQLISLRNKITLEMMVDTSYYQV